VAVVIAAVVLGRRRQKKGKSSNRNNKNQPGDGAPPPRSASIYQSDGAHEKLGRQREVSWVWATDVDNNRVGRARNHYRLPSFYAPGYTRNSIPVSHMLPRNSVGQRPQNKVIGNRATFVLQPNPKYHWYHPRP